MAKAYYKLKDQGSSFYDIGGAQGIVGKNIGLLDVNGRVILAERDGVLIKLDKEEAGPKYKAQQAALPDRIKAKEAAAIEAKEAASTPSEEAPEDGTEEDTQAAKKAAAGKK